MRDVMLDNFFFPYPQSPCPQCAARVNVGTNSDLLSDGSIRVPEICPFCQTPLRALQKMDEAAEAGIKPELDIQREYRLWMEEGDRLSKEFDDAQVAKKVAKKAAKIEAAKIEAAKVAKEIEAAKVSLATEKRIHDLVVSIMSKASPLERIDFFKRTSENPEMVIRDEILKYSKEIHFSREEWLAFEIYGWTQEEDWPKEFKSPG